MFVGTLYGLISRGNEIKENPPAIFANSSPGNLFKLALIWQRTYDLSLPFVGGAKY